MGVRSSSSRAGVTPNWSRVGGSWPRCWSSCRSRTSAQLDFTDDDGTVRPWAHGSLERARLQDLTPREREILVLLAGGARTSEIARRLVISEKTVKTHVQNILRKLDVTSRLEAAAIAVRAGFVPLSAS